MILGRLVNYRRSGGEEKEGHGSDHAMMMTQ